jgi:hypothetical protein
VLWPQKTIALQQKVPRVKVWAIAKTFTSILNKVVIAYVMNQLQGHWLLFDALNTCINLTLILEVEVGHGIDAFDVLDAFDVEL